MDGLRIYSAPEQESKFLNFSVFQVVVYKCVGIFVVYCKLSKTRTRHAKLNMSKF